MSFPRVITGVARRHLGRGTNLGYPTANILYSGDARDGVYFGRATIQRKSLHDQPALIFIGKAVTFDETKRWVEVHILDFSGSLYNESITLTLEHFSRENRKFATPEELVAQIKQDEVLARAYFKIF